MNTANLDLCKELYVLSGWLDDSSFMWGGWNGEDWRLEYGKASGIKDVSYPAYDLGYLIRQLPYHLRLERYSSDKWLCITFKVGNEYTTKTFRGEPADTPEDAACKLAIELFKQGVLTKQGKE